MNPITLAHQYPFSQQVDWTGFIIGAFAVLLTGIIGLIWHHRSPATTKRSFRFYSFLVLSCISFAAILLSLTYESIYGPSIEDTFHQLSIQGPESLEEILSSMVLLSKESETYRKEKIILGTEKSRFLNQSTD